MDKKSKSLLMIGISFLTVLTTLITCDPATAMMRQDPRDEQPICGRWCQP